MIIFQELQHQSWPCYYQVHFLVASIHQALLLLHPSTPHKQHSSPDCLLFIHHSKQDRSGTHKMGQPSISEGWVCIKKVQIKCIEKDEGGRELIIPDSPKEASLKRFYPEDKNSEKVYPAAGSTNKEKGVSLKAKKIAIIMWHLKIKISYKAT